MQWLTNSLAGLLQRLKTSRPPTPRERFWPNPATTVFLVSYPRSGTTWLSCVATELLFRISPRTLSDIACFVPDLHALPEKSAVPAARLHLVKSHFQLNQIHGFPPYGDYRRVVYLVRDPRDILLSYYRFARAYTDYRRDFKEFAMDWVMGRIWPCSWQEHVNSWLEPMSRTMSFELTLVRYEDFVADPIGQTKVLAKVLGLDPGPSRIEEIVEDTSPETMRVREANEKDACGGGRNFIGPAKPGNWKGIEDGDVRDGVAIVESYALHAMRRVGYECSTKANQSIFRRTGRRFAS